MSPLDRFLLQANGAFEAVLDTMTSRLTTAWDAVVYDFPYWVSQKVKRS